MSKSRITTYISVLCLAALLAITAGCEEQAAKEPSAAPAKEAKAAAPAKEAAKHAETKPAAEKPKEATPPPAPTTGPGPHKFAANWMDEPGFITHWLIVGPFPNPGDRPDNAGFNIDYLKNYGGEPAYTPANGAEVKKDDGTTVKWQQYISESSEIDFFSVDFLGLEPAQEDVLVYCACWLNSDADKDVDIRLGSDDGYKLWINNKEVGVAHEYRSMEMDQETYKVKLNKGKNLIMLKVDQDYGEFEFMLRVVTADGKEAPGITVWN